MSRSRRPGPSTRVRVHEVTTGPDGRGPPARGPARHRGAAGDPAGLAGPPGRAGRGDDAHARATTSSSPPGSCTPRACSPRPRTCARSPTAPTRRSPPSRSSTSSPSSSAGRRAGPRPSGTPGCRRPRRPAGCAAPRASTTCWRCATCARPDRWDGPGGRLRGAARRCPDRLRDAAAGLRHAPAACTRPGSSTRDGTPLVVREDIGRHNAVDKVVGARMLAGDSPAAPVLVRERPDRLRDRAEGRGRRRRRAGRGRRARPASRSTSPSRAGLCTAGFVRGERYVVYSAAGRLGV